MKMDMVATQAKAGKASVYRRWSSKKDLVQDALIWMATFRGLVQRQPFDKQSYAALIDGILLPALNNPHNKG